MNFWSRFPALFWPPNLMSLIRLGLGVALLAATPSVSFALLALLAAGVTDVLDGWLARRLKMVTAVGAWLDPLADKVFAVGAVLASIRLGALKWPWAALLFAREAGFVAIAIAMFLTKRSRALLLRPRVSLPLGKLATVAQFIAMAWGYLGWPGLEAVLTLSGAIGIGAAFVYARRERRTSAPSTHGRLLARH